MSDYLLDEAIKAINSGNKQSGRWLLTDLLRDDPYNEEAWSWMSLVATSDEERRQCLEQVLAINPNNEEARRELAMLLPKQEAVYQHPRVSSFRKASASSQQCPLCGAHIDADDTFCRFCGQQLEEETTESDTPTAEPQQLSRKPWYFSTPILILTFLFITPLWSILVLADEQQGGFAKAFAVLIAIIYVALVFLGSVYLGALSGP